MRILSRRTQRIADGLTLERLRLTVGTGKPVVATALAVDLARYRWRAALTRPPEQTSAVLKRSGGIAGVNGGFFNVRTFSPLFGLTIAGRSIHPLAARKALLVSTEGRTRIVERSRAPRRATDLLQAGPLLVQNGRIVFRRGQDREGFRGDRTRFTSDITWGRYPRTAVGLSGNTLFLIVVDGRQPRRSVGLTLRELAALCVRLGAHEALNLDGGSSSRFVVGGKLVTRPSASPYTRRAKEGYEKPVPIHLCLYKKPSAAEATDAPGVRGAKRRA